jgi:hypothetical protein
LGGAQDFQFTYPGQRYEVKSLRPGRTDVEISSEEQLEGEDINLVVVTMEEVHSSEDGLTLPLLVKSIRSKLLDGSARAEFNRKFARLAVNLADAWYAERAYSITKLQIYGVRTGFPALTRSELPSAISQVVYRLNIKQLTDYLALNTTYKNESTSDGE